MITEYPQEFLLRVFLDQSGYKPRSPKEEIGMAKLQGMAKRDARSTAVAATIFLFPAVALLIVYMS